MCCCYLCLSWLQRSLSVMIVRYSDSYPFVSIGSFCGRHCCWTDWIVNHCCGCNSARMFPNLETGKVRRMFLILLTLTKPVRFEHPVAKSWTPTTPNITRIRNLKLPLLLLPEPNLTKLIRLEDHVSRREAVKRVSWSSLVMLVAHQMRLLTKDKEGLLRTIVTISRHCIRIHMMVLEDPSPNPTLELTKA